MIVPGTAVIETHAMCRELSSATLRGRSTEERNRGDGLPRTGSGMDADSPDGTSHMTRWAA